MRRSWLLALLALVSAVGSHADDGCAGYRGNVSVELALAQGPAEELTAGRVGSEAPALELGRHLAVKLWPESAVILAAQPGKRFSTEAPHAGLLLLEPVADGTYAVGAAPRLWFELVDLATDTAVAATAFDMRLDCPAMAKRVEFSLEAGRRYVLQLTSAPGDRADLVITRRVDP